MEKVYQICFYSGLSIAILLFIVAMVLFVTLKIPKVFGELTGITARKSIKENKMGYEQVNAKKNGRQVKARNISSKGSPADGGASARTTIIKKNSKPLRWNRQDTTTGRLLENEHVINAEEAEAPTIVLGEANAPTVVLGEIESPTVVLNEESGLTEVLESEPPTEVLESEPPTEYKYYCNYVIVHTNEAI